MTAPFGTTPSPVVPAAAWWTYLVRGVLALALGIYAITLPGAALLSVVFVLGAYFIIDGIFAIVKGAQMSRAGGSAPWQLIIVGLIGIVVGVVAFAAPGLTLVSLAYLIGFWAIVTGVMEFIAAFRMPSVAREVFYMIFGIVSVIFGVAVFFAPAYGLYYIVISIAIFGFVAGIALITAAFRIRKGGSAAV